MGRFSRGLIRGEADTILGPEGPPFYEPTLGGPFKLSSFGFGELVFGISEVRNGWKLLDYINQHLFERLRL